MSKPLMELLEQAQHNKRKKIAVISTDFVLKKLRQHENEQRQFKPPDRLIETFE